MIAHENFGDDLSTRHEVTVHYDDDEACYWLRIWDANGNTVYLMANDPYAIVNVLNGRASPTPPSDEDN